MIYGFVQRRKYAAIEKVVREEEEAKRPAREAFLAREKLLRDTGIYRYYFLLYVFFESPFSLQPSWKNWKKYSSELARSMSMMKQYWMKHNNGETLKSQEILKKKIFY